VSVSKRERECVCVCVCLRERERVSERARRREKERECLSEKIAECTGQGDWSYLMVKSHELLQRALWLLNRPPLAILWLGFVL